MGGIREIPEKLKRPEFRFALVKEDSKLPYEMDWQNTKNYAFDDPIIANHLQFGGNIGLVLGFGGIIVIDCDTHEFAQKMKNINTFQIRTKSGGLHLYFKTDYIPKEAFKLLKENGSAIGEYRVSRCQVLVPPSVVEGKEYVIENDAPIAELNKDEMIKLIGNYLIPDSQNTPKEGVDTTRSGVEFGEVCKLIRKGYGKDELFRRMETYKKWAESHPQYKELTYTKALQKTQDELQNKVTRNVNRLDLSDISDVDTLRDEIERHLLDINIDFKALRVLISDFLIHTYHFKTIRYEEKSECYLYADGIYTHNAQTFVAEFARNLLGKHFSSDQVKGIMDHIKAQTFIHEHEFIEKDKNLICVHNGILNIKTRELIPFTPDRYFFTKIPVDYNPTSTCEPILTFFDQILPKDDVKVMQELFGYCLLREYPIAKFFVFSGSGRNGKGVTLLLLQHFLGHENVKQISLFDLSDNQFSKSELKDKLANVNADLPDKMINDTGKIKELTGNDWVSAPRKFLATASFRNHAKLIFSTNGMPTFDDDSDGFRRRWLLIEFNKKFYSQREINELSEEEKKDIKLADPALFSKLLEGGNMEGLLNWALEGLSRLMDSGSFSDIKTNKETMDIVHLKGNPYPFFIRDCFIETDPECDVPKSRVRVLFREWCKYRGIKFKLSEQLIRKALEETFAVTSGRKYIDDRRYTAWFGISEVPNPFGVTSPVFEPLNSLNITTTQLKEE